MAIHGSLNRAGKVKNQTPKVQCLLNREFRRVKNGRAKKRKQYKRYRAKMNVTELTI